MAPCLLPCWPFVVRNNNKTILFNKILTTAIEKNHTHTYILGLPRWLGWQRIFKIQLSGETKVENIRYMMVPFILNKPTRKREGNICVSA